MRPLIRVGEPAARAVHGRGLGLEREGLRLRVALLELHLEKSTLRAFIRGGVPVLKRRSERPSSRSLSASGPEGASPSDQSLG